MPSYDKLKERFISACQMRHNVDYGNKASVQEYNKGMNICRKVMQQIDTQHPEQLEDFLRLLNHPDAEIRYMCAFCSLEVAHLSNEQEHHALEKVAEYFDTRFSPMTMAEWYAKWNTSKRR